MAVIFIPGIKGTELVDTYPLDWVPRWHAHTANPMGLALADGHVDARDARWMQPGQLFTEAYGSLIHKLRAWLTPEPVHAFGYDWRQPLETSARRLVTWMDDIVEHERLAGRDPTLKFVTHSMGGLLLRSALRLRNTRDPFAGVGRTVFIAPPFRGSIGAPYALVVGETDSWFNTDQGQRHVTRGFPSVYQMTPSWRGAAIAEDGRPVDLYDPDNWQANVRQANTFSPDFVRHAEAFVHGRRARHGGHSSAPMLDDAVLAKAADKVLIISGSGQPTPCALPVLTRNARNPNWFDFAHARIDTRGDGRVWLPSAAVKGVRLAAFAGSGEHGFACRDTRVASLTSLWLQGQGALMLTPRGPNDPVKRPRRFFPVWDGRMESLDKHTA
ncbi:MAG TPA: hypothetical protein VF269_07610 [Rhodanobacteraceae bacterium]